MILLFLLTLAVWILRPSWLMLLWLISIPVLAPLIILYSDISNTEDLEKYLLQIWGIFQRVFIVIVAFHLIYNTKKIPLNINKILFPCGLLCAYFIFHNGIRHYDVSLLYQNVAGAFYDFLPILVMILDKKVRPKLKAVFGVVLFIVILQLIMVPFNLEGIIVYTMRYEDNLFLQEELGLVSGTFIQSNALADFLSMVYLFVCVDFFSRRGMATRLFFVVSIIILALLALTGSKMPIICSLMALFMCIFYYKRHLILPVTGLFVGLLLTIVITWGNIAKLGEEYRGVDRFANGIVTFFKSKDGGRTDNTTVSISKKLIDNYYMESPIIGCGYAYKGQDKAYPLNININSGLSNFMADATLALHLVEYGAIGIMLFLWYYFSLINYSVNLAFGKNNAITIIIFMFLLAFSVTEGGFFYRPNFFYIYTYIFAVQRFHEEKTMLSRPKHMYKQTFA